MGIVKNLGKKVRIFGPSFALALLLIAPSHADESDDPAFTDSPVKATGNFVLHKLFPLRESDEAYAAHDAGDFSSMDLHKLIQGSSEDYFSEMDYGLTLPENQDFLQQGLQPFSPGITKGEAARRAARGRNNWIVWTGGNDRFWNYMTRATLGGLDLIKTLSDHPSLASTRDNRWEELGVVNEPCFEKARGPRADRWGLWLDERSANCPADPFEDEIKHPGVKVGARGTIVKYRGQAKQIPVGSSYGYATGIVGLRLFPNPDFDQKAADNWDPERYYNDPSYYTNANLVRPYRVGMACAFCHVGPNPSRPPADFNHPAWSNLNSNPGAQYFWVDRILNWDYKHSQDSFVYQLLHTSRPGALDTSLISSDQINNPRTMNAVYDMPARVKLNAKMGGWEKIRGEEMKNMQFNALGDSALSHESPLRGLYDFSSDSVISPRVLKDGSDSVGVLGALNRVYVNIGLFSEEWIENFIPLVGGPDVTPFKIDTAEKKSLYWQANVNQTPDLALFMLALTRTDKLAGAPGGKAYLKPLNSATVALGKKVFAQNCAGCHSSKLPEKAYTFFTNSKVACNGPGYLYCWYEYNKYINGPEFKKEMEKIVAEKDFLKDNYLSTDLRVPVTELDSQLCSPLATNALKGSIWDNFSSSTYKELSPVGKFTVNFINENGESQSEVQTVPGGGRGYLRPPSLISAWSTAPFLINNTVGKFDYRGTVEGRMSSFNDSIEKLLNPEDRAPMSTPGHMSVAYKTSFGDTLHGTVDVTTADSYLKVPRGYLTRGFLKNFEDAIRELHVNASDVIKKGPVYAKTELWREPAPKGWLERAFASLKFWKNSPDKNGNRAIASYGDSADYSDDKMGDILYLGPIPAGVPVNLISSISFSADPLDQFKAIYALVKAVKTIKNQNLAGEAAKKEFMAIAAAPLLKVSSCKDFVVDRGHYFGSEYSPQRAFPGYKPLNAEEKTALAEFMKHF